MNKNLKDYIKYIVKVSYRKDIRMLMKESTFEQISHVNNRNAKNIVIIQRQNTKVGIFSDYIVFLKCIEYSIEKNLIPIIDRKTIKNDFLPADGNINTWELFFEQPLKMGLEEINTNTMNVSSCYTGGLYPVSLLRCYDMDVINYWRGIASKYIKFTSEMANHLKIKCDEILKNNRVLGVSVREGYRKLAEMKSGIVKGHAVQASSKSIIEDTKKYMQKWNCQCVFFTCQTNDTVEEFVQAFGNNALYYKRDRVSYHDLIEGKQIKQIKEFEQAVHNEKNYITEIYILSRCTSFLCSENSGSEAAFILSKGFENFYCYDLGTY